MKLKSTGVIRRIDELGRIVIPKEIRKNLGIKEGDGVEFILEEDTILLKKASASNQFQKLASSLVNGIYAVTKKNLVVTDLNTVIACNDKVGNKYLNKELLTSYVNLVKKREVFVANDIANMDVVKVDEDKKYYLMIPIVVNGDLMGSLFLYSEDVSINELDKFLLKFVLYFLEKNIEE